MAQKQSTPFGHVPVLREETTCGKVIHSVHYRVHAIAARPNRDFLAAHFANVSVDI